MVLSAQFTDFDLSQYKLPDIRLHRLDATVNFFNTANSSFSRNPLNTTKTKNNDLNGKLNLGYYNFRNSEKYQGINMLNAYLYPDRDRYITENNDIKTTSTQIQFMFNGTNRFYNPKLFFLEVSPSFYYYTDRSNEQIKNSDVTENRDRLSTTQLSANVSAGYGRIEPVEDLRLAIYILEELQKGGRITDIPPVDVVISMAREISRIKKKRFFDTRLRKIEELHVIDSFLVANDIISSNDIAYFTVLNDNWDYSAGPARETGFALNAGVGNDIMLSRISEKNTINGIDVTDNKYYSNEYEIGGFLNVKYAKPLNLYWQTGAGINSFYGIGFTRNPDDKEDPMENYETNIFRTSISGLLHYLPNSRTSIGLDITGQYDHSYIARTLTELDPDGYRIKSNLFSIISSFNMYYYVSPRLRVQLLTSITGNNSLRKVRFETALPEEEYLNRSFFHNISLTFTYSFF